MKRYLPILLYIIPLIATVITSRLPYLPTGDRRSDTIEMIRGGTWLFSFLFIIATAMIRGAIAIHYWAEAQRNLQERPRGFDVVMPEKHCPRDADKM